MLPPFDGKGGKKIQIHRNLDQSIDNLNSLLNQEELGSDMNSQKSAAETQTTETMEYSTTSRISNSEPIEEINFGLLFAMNHSEVEVIQQSQFSDPANDLEDILRSLST